MRLDYRKIKRKIKSFYRQPYKQFMFHFEGRNSIDARNMNQEELDFCRMFYNDIGFWKNGRYIGNHYNNRTAKKLFELWRPQELI